MSKRIHIGKASLQSYLREQVKVLTVVESDLRCLPSTEGTSDVLPSDPTEIIICPDWSEIHAYIFGENVPSGDVASHAKLDKKILHASHFSAMDCLFRFFPTKLTLLPAYYHELNDFLEIVKEKKELLSLRSLLNKNKTIDELTRDSELYHCIHNALIKDKKRTSKLRDVNDLFELALHEDPESDLAKIQKGEIENWVKNSFSDDYLITRLSESNGLSLLHNLLTGKSGEKKLVAPNEIITHQISSRRGDINERKLFWVSELSKYNSARKNKPLDARTRDAESLAIVECINTDLLQHNMQMVLVTRSRDIRKCIEDNPNSFALLNKESVRGSPGEKPTTAFRSWHHFFELGVVMHSSNLRERRIQIALERRSRARVYLNWLERGVPVKDVRNECAKSLQKDVQNVETFLSSTGHRTSLHKNQTRANFALQSIINHVTNPQKFIEKRSQLAHNINGFLSNIVRDSSYLTPKLGLTSFFASQRRSPLRALLKQLPLNSLNYNGSNKFPTMCKSHFKNILRCIKSDEQNSDMLKQLFSDQIALERKFGNNEEIDRSFLIMKAALKYIDDSPDEVSLLLDPLATNLARDIPILWAIYIVLDTEIIAVTQDDPKDSCSYLDMVMEQEEIGTQVHELSDSSLIAEAAITKSFFLLCLDTIDEQSQGSLSPTDTHRDVVTLLANRLDSAIMLLYELKNRNNMLSRLQSALANNIVYAVSILNFMKPNFNHLDTHLKLIDALVTKLAKKRTLSASECHSLGIYYASTGHYDKSNKYLYMASDLWKADKYNNGPASLVYTHMNEVDELQRAHLGVPLV